MVCLYHSIYFCNKRVVSQLITKKYMNDMTVVIYTNGANPKKLVSHFYKNSIYRVIVFTDADCLPDFHWLDKL
jgi:hypothetical protein